IVCGGAQTLLNGTCTINGVATVSNTSRGTGTLVPSSATAVFALKGFTGDVADSVLVPITLASKTPTPPPAPTPTAPAASIGTVTINGAATIGAPGPNTPVAISVGNTGGTLSNASL